MATDLVWSKADTHCVWCGKPFGDADAECDSSCTKGTWLDATLVKRFLSSLRATIEALTTDHVEWVKANPAAAVTALTETGAMEQVEGTWFDPTEHRPYMNLGSSRQPHDAKDQPVYRVVEHPNGEGT